MKTGFLSVLVWLFIGIATVFVPNSIKSKTTETTVTNDPAVLTANTSMSVPQPGALAISRSAALDKSRNISTTSSDSKDIQPFRAGAGADGTIIVTVPEGKLLVIELVSGSVSTPGANSEVAVRLVTSPAGADLTGLYDIAPSHVRPTGTHTYAVYTQPVRIYVLAGERLVMFFPADGAALGITVSGYFVDQR